MSEFDALSPEDKAYLVQYWRTRDRMQAWEQQEQAREAENASKH